MAFETIDKLLSPRRVTLQYSDGASDRILLQVDCTTGERPEYESAATRHPVEDGSTVTDHIIDKGVRLVLDGIVSNHPINLATALVGDAAGVLGGVLSGPVGTIATAATVAVGNRLVAKSANPAKDALNVFKEIRAKKALLTIITGLDTYTNMVLERFTPIRNAANGGALVFSATFSQVTIVETVNVAVPREAMSADTRTIGAAKQDGGRQQPRQPTGAQDKTAESFLYKIYKHFSK